jgi:hypothetical protein
MSIKTWYEVRPWPTGDAKLPPIVAFQAVEEDGWLCKADGGRRPLGKPWGGSICVPTFEEAKQLTIDGVRRKLEERERSAQKARDMLAMVEGMTDPALEVAHG